MRVVASGNLTVELIRAQRFDVAYRADALEDACRPSDRAQVHADTHCRVDRVELSPQAVGCDPWATPVERADHAIEPGLAIDNEDAAKVSPADPRPLSPVVGSPALGGLGVAWVVPGTLLDVVA